MTSLRRLRRSSSLLVQILTVQQIGEAAENVLNGHQLERAIPVEIEEIIEFGVEIEIRPVKALYDRFGFEGALSHDLQTILVDADIQHRNLNRYRFTLAHELGHYVLHGGYISSLIFDEKSDWKKAVTGIDPKSYGRMEYQAYMFAGHILVPTQSLVDSCKEAQEIAIERNIDLSAMGEGAISYVAGWIAKEYKVSTSVIERRLRNEKITFE